MAVKVLVNAIGQHIVADAKQVEEKETKKIIAYLLTNPRVAAYSRDDEGNVNVGFAPYCIVSDDQEFTLRAENVVSILEPRADVRQKYEEMVNPPAIEADGGVTVSDAVGVAEDSAEDGEVAEPASVEITE